MGQTCTLVCVWLLAVVSLGLTLAALLTDYWYQVDTSDNLDPEVKKAYNFHFGLWRMCYDEGMPAEVAGDDSYNKDGSSCVFIFKQLIQKNEDDLDYNSRLRIHLSRTVLGCSIACAAAILGALMSLLFGLCHLRCCAQSSSKKPCVYLSASVLLLLATMCGIASGISFIAVRDLDNTEVRTVSSSSSPVMPLPPALPEYVSQDYGWSFMLHWIGTGLCLVDSFLLLCLLHNSYQFVGQEGSKWSRYSSI